MPSCTRCWRAWTRCRTWRYGCGPKAWTSPCAATWPGATIRRQPWWAPDAPLARGRRQPRRRAARRGAGARGPAADPDRGRRRVVVLVAGVVARRGADPPAAGTQPRAAGTRARPAVAGPPGGDPRTHAGRTAGAGPGARTGRRPPARGRRRGPARLGRRAGRAGTVRRGGAGAAARDRAGAGGPRRGPPPSWVDGHGAGGGRRRGPARAGRAAHRRHRHLLRHLVRTAARHRRPRRPDAAARRRGPGRPRPPAGAGMTTATTEARRPAPPRPRATRGRWRARWYRVAVPVLAAALLIGVTVAARMLEEPDLRAADTLAPAGTGPDGGSELARLLTAEGVHIDYVTSLEEAVAALGPLGDAVVFIPRPTVSGTRLANAAA